MASLGRSFAAYAANGKVLQRKLFVDERRLALGLAFVDSLPAAVRRRAHQSTIRIR